MWSTSDTTGRYHLVKSVDGAAPVAVGVPDREGPFDVDLGTNRSGSPYAVYTRDGLIYRLNVATGAEQRLTKLSIGGRNQRPTIQRGEIAFLHSGRGHSELRIGNTTSGAKPPRVLVRGTIDDIELGIGKVAYTLRSGRRVTVHVRNIRTGHDNAVYRASSGGANTSVVTKPSFTDDLKAFVWARANIGSQIGNRIVRYTLRSGRLSYAAGAQRVATAAWVDQQRGVIASTALDPARNQGCDDAGVHYCAVILTGPLTFTARP
jgi:hypothetical protein